MEDNKRLNSDWTIREDRIPRKNDVVFDHDSVICLVTESAGEFGRKTLKLEDVNGKLVHQSAPASSVRIANSEHTKKFFEDHSKNTGWIRNRIYNVSGADYPMQLVELTYDTVKQKVLYMFRDMNVPEVKYVKTHDRSLVEKIPDWLYECTEFPFSADDSSKLSNEILISIRENPRNENSWSVAGSSFAFPSRESALAEIDRW